MEGGDGWKEWVARGEKQQQVTEEETGKGGKGGRMKGVTGESRSRESGGKGDRGGREITKQVRP